MTTLSYFPNTEHRLYKEARELGMDMNGPIDDWAVARARHKKQVDNKC
jgi:hypothetical protein